MVVVKPAPDVLGMVSDQLEVVALVLGAVMDGYGMQVVRVGVIVKFGHKALDLLFKFLDFVFGFNFFLGHF